MENHKTVTNKNTTLQLYNNALINTTDTIAKTPLKASQSKSKLKIKGDVAYLKVPFAAYVIGFFMSLIVYGGWGLVLYGIYNGQFYINSDSYLLVDIIITLFLFLMLLMLSFYNWFIKSNLKSSAYIYKTTGEIKSFNNEEEYNLQDISCIQLLSYEEKVKISSKYGGGYDITLVYEINLVAHNKDRFTILKHKKEDKAIQFCEKLSEFLEKPFVNHMSHHEKV